MNNEISICKNESADAVEMTSAVEMSFAREFSEPAEEYHQSECEFSQLQCPAAQASDSAGKKAQKHRRHKKVINKMACLIASAAAVVTISNTLSSASVEGNVAAAGGSVNGDLRFSIQWNDHLTNPDDLDAHCIEPTGYEIYYENAGLLSGAGGVLDVDIVQPGAQVAVENIVYEHKRDMQEGVYQFFVHNFCDEGGFGGFTAQIEIEGRIHNFHYNRSVPNGEIVPVAEVTYRNGTFQIKKLL